MNNKQTENTEAWCENVIVVDADYVDSVAFNLIVNFERMIQRRIPQADMAHWLDCIALDGGVRQKNDAQQQGSETQVVFIHGKDTASMKNFKPGNFNDDLNQKAFKDNLGEFMMNCYPVESATTKTDFILDVVKTAANHKDVKRLMIVADCDDGTMPDYLRQALRDADDDKRITVFAMQPVTGGNFRQEILGYSLMSALGISSNELK